MRRRWKGEPGLQVRNGGAHTLWHGTTETEPNRIYATEHGRPASLKPLGVLHSASIMIPHDMGPLLVMIYSALLRVLMTCDVVHGLLAELDLAWMYIHGSFVCLVTLFCVV